MGLLLMSVAGCSSQADVPSSAGLCLQLVEDANQSPAYVVIDREVPNLESCAVQLEGARMLAGKPTSGVYNGHYIFANEEQITSSRALGGTRIRVFQSEDRREIQKGLQTLIELQTQTAGPPT